MVLGFAFYFSSLFLLILEDYNYIPFPFNFLIVSLHRQYLNSEIYEINQFACSYYARDLLNFYIPIRIKLECFLTPVILFSNF